MNFTVTNKGYAKTVFNTLLNKVQDGKIYRITFEETKSLKTKKQLGFIFGGVIKALCLYFSRIGYDFTPDMVKEWLYSEIGVVDTFYLPNGVQKSYIKTLSNMTKKETSDFIFKLITFIDTSEALSDFILPPDLRYCWVNHIDSALVDKVLLEVFPRHSESYLNHIRKLTCIRCGAKGGQAHHIKRGSGFSRKNDDWFTIPLCNKCHIEHLHNGVGEPYVLNEIKPIIGGLDIELFCKIMYYMWQHNYGC